MATLHSASDGGQVLFVKGAPEVILDHCTLQETDGGPVALQRQYWTEASDRLAAQGERVLALAWLPKPGLQARSLGPADLPRQLVLLGLVGLMDPPRKEAIEAVTECHNGGIRVTMITGDHKITAAAIAKMLGIGDGKTAVAGAEIEEMNDSALRERVRDVDVFARASPEHKLRLVKAIQDNGQIVAMTGDGVNDAPALKRADIGVAMGIKGTEVTKEAAAMVLADDNFASITAAVREGRTVYNNIEKALLFMLPTNVAQALVILVAIIVGFTLPITAPQILWVNMVTSVALGLIISFEPHESDVMQRPPRMVSRPLLDSFAVWRVVFVGLALLALTLGAFFWMKSQGAADELARAVAVNALVIGQVFYLLNSRYKTEFLVLDTGASRQSLFAAWRRSSGSAADPVHLCAARPAPVRHRIRAAPMSGHGCSWAASSSFWSWRQKNSSYASDVHPWAAPLAIGSSGLRPTLPLAMNAAQPSAPGRIRGASWSAWQGLIGALAVLGLVGGEVYSFWRQRDGGGYIAEVAERSAMAHGISATGTIDVQTKALVKALVSGKIEKLHCEPGAKVQAGQLCASIDPRPYQLALDRQKSVLAAAKLQRDKDAAALARAKSEFERKQTLVGARRRLSGRAGAIPLRL